MYELNDNDLKWLQKIVNITKHIDSIYDKLYELEISDKKDTSQYRDLLDNLSIFIKVEDDIYKQIYIDSFMCEEFTIYILQNYLDPSFFSKYYGKYDESIMNQDYNNRIYIRIINNIHNFATLKLEKYEYIGKLNRDITFAHLYFLEELKNLESFNKFNTEFINQKYNMSFINKDIELELIDTKFEIPNEYYSIISLYEELIFDLTNLQTIKKEKLLKSAKNQINEILKLRKDKLINSIIRLCYLRSLLLFMSKEDINILITTFENIEVNKTNHKNKELIDICFKSIKNDKSKVNILTFNPIK